MKNYYILLFVLLVLPVALSLSISVGVPQNKTYNTTAFTFQVSSTQNLASVKYSLDQGNSTEMASIDNLTWTADVNVTEGAHNVKFTAVSGNETANETVLFTVDTTHPVVNLLSPDDNSTVTNEATLVYVMSEAHPKVCYTYVNSSLVDKNSSPQNGSNYSVTYEFNSTGVYYWNVTCVDEGNNSNTSETWSFVGAVTPPNDPPIVNISYPSNKAYQEISEVHFNVTDDNASVLECSYKIDSHGWINVSASNNTEVKVYPSIVDDEGQHTLQVNCSDGALIGSVTVTFTVDRTPPSDLSITINDGDSVATSREVTITLNARGASECAFSNDSVSWTEWSSVSLGDRSYILPPGDGVKTVYYKCRDNTEPPNISPVVSDSITLKLCGNGIIDEGEVCDGSNVTSGYYCSSDCKHKYLKSQSSPSYQSAQTNTPTSQSEEKSQEPEFYTINLKVRIPSNGSIIEKFFNNSDEVANYSRKAVSDVKLSSEIKSSSDGSTIDFSGSYIGKDTLKSLVLILKIPKSFASNSKNISVSTTGKIEVLEEDPVYAVRFSNVTNEFSFEITFTVKEEVDLEEVKDDLENPEILAEPLVDETSKKQVQEPVTEQEKIKKSVSNTTTVEKRKNASVTGLVLIGGVTFVVILFSIVLIVGLIAVYLHVKKRGKGFKLGPRVRL